MALLPLIFLSLLLISSTKAAAEIVNSDPSSLTVIAISNAAKIDSSIDLTRVHLIPVHLPLASLKSLPVGAKITSFLQGDTITLTSLASSAVVSLDNVPVQKVPLYDDGNGSLLIYRIDNFIHRSTFPLNRPDFVYAEAIQVMKSKGFASMSFALRHRNDQMTVFAPFDTFLDNRIGRLTHNDFYRHNSLLLRHAVRRRFSSSELSSLPDGSVLRTFLEGFTITVSQNGSVSKVNGVPVIMPEIYQNHMVVVYAIAEAL